jgi:hypothetical protein
MKTRIVDPISFFDAATPTIMQIILNGPQLQRNAPLFAPYFATLSCGKRAIPSA